MMREAVQFSLTQGTGNFCLWVNILQQQTNGFTACFLWGYELFNFQLKIVHYIANTSIHQIYIQMFLETHNLSANLPLHSAMP